MFHTWCVGESVIKCLAIWPSVGLFLPFPHESPCEPYGASYRLSGNAISLLESEQCQVFCHCMNVWESYESIQKDSCVTESSPSQFWHCFILSLSLSRVMKAALSHVSSYFQSKQSRWEAAGLRANNAHIQLLCSPVLRMQRGKEAGYATTFTHDDRKRFYSGGLWY